MIPLLGDVFAMMASQDSTPAPKAQAPPQEKQGDFSRILKDVERGPQKESNIKEAGQENDDKENPSVMVSQTTNRHEPLLPPRKEMQQTQIRSSHFSLPVAEESPLPETNIKGEHLVKNLPTTSSELLENFRPLDGQKDGLYNLKEYNPNPSSGGEKEAVMGKLVNDTNLVPKFFNPPGNVPEALSSQVSLIDNMELSPAKNVIHEIVQYMELNKMAHQQKLDVIVNHGELGRFQLGVMRKGGDPIELSITTNTSKGYQFFNDHGAELSRALNKIGGVFEGCENHG